MRSRFRLAHRPRLYLSRRRKFAVYAIIGATWGSGVAWLFFHYLLMRQGKFGPEPHPFETWSLALHGACAFAALWLGGLLWPTHIVPWWTGGERRSSGIVLIGMAGVLIVSGYLLYYAGGDGARGWIELLHWMVGLLLAIALLVHALRSSRYRAPRHADK